MKNTIKTMEDGYKLLTQQEHTVQRNLNRNQYYGDPTQFRVNDKARQYD